MSTADCRIVVTQEKVATCGAMTVRMSDIPCFPVLRFDGTDKDASNAFLCGHIKRDGARDLAHALLAYLDAPEAE